MPRLTYNLRFQVSNIDQCHPVHIVESYWWLTSVAMDMRLSQLRHSLYAGGNVYMVFETTITSLWSGRTWTRDSVTISWHLNAGVVCQQEYWYCKRKHFRWELKENESWTVDEPNQSSRPCGTVGFSRTLPDQWAVCFSPRDVSWIRKWYFYHSAVLTEL